MKTELTQNAQTYYDAHPEEAVRVMRADRAVSYGVTELKDDFCLPLLTKSLKAAWVPVKGWAVVKIWREGPVHHRQMMTGALPKARALAIAEGLNKPGRPLGLDSLS